MKKMEENDFFKEFKYLCWQLDFAFGKGTLIDSDFSSTVIQDDGLSLDTIRGRLVVLREKCKDLNDCPPLYIKTYMERHIDALLMQIRLKEGPVDFIEATNVLYDIEAEKPDKHRIEELHEELYELLNSCGYKEPTLQKKVKRWNENGSVKADEFLIFAKEKAAYYFSLVRKKFADIIDFDEIDDHLEFKITTTDSGWAAYNYYLKNYTGVVEFNSSARFNKYTLNTFISHEGYPGHHTSGIVKEFLYRHGKTNDLATINLLSTPSSLIEEGIGDCGLKIIDSGDLDAETAVSQLISVLNAEAYYYAAYDYLHNGQSEEKLIEFLIRYKLHTDEASACRALQFVKNWGYYIPTYKYGRETVASYLKDSEYPISRLYNICCHSTLELMKDEIKVRRN